MAIFEFGPDIDGSRSVSIPQIVPRKLFLNSPQNALEVQGWFLEIWSAEHIYIVVVEVSQLIILSFRSVLILPPFGLTNSIFNV